MLGWVGLGLLQTHLLAIYACRETLAPQVSQKSKQTIFLF